MFAFAVKVFDTDFDKWNYHFIYADTFMDAASQIEDMYESSVLNLEIHKVSNSTPWLSEELYEKILAESAENLDDGWWV